MEKPKWWEFRKKKLYDLGNKIESFDDISLDENLNDDSDISLDDSILDSNPIQENDITDAPINDNINNDTTNDDLNEEISLKEELDTDFFDHNKDDVAHKKNSILHTINIYDFILFHKKQIIVFCIGFFALLFILYASQVGINTTVAPVFSNQNIKIVKAENINTKYGFGEKVAFHNAVMQFILESGDVVEIEGDFSISASFFSMISKSLKGATINISNSKLKVYLNNAHEGASMQSIIIDAFEQKSGKNNIFTNIKFLNTKVSIINTNSPEESFFFDDITIKNNNTSSNIVGIIKVNQHRINVEYNYYFDSTKNNNYQLSLKSQVFEFSINGNKQSYGTITKEDKIKGRFEMTVRSVEQFTSLFLNAQNISRYLINFPQFSLSGNFEYDSLGGLLKIEKGKINFLNSLGTFELSTITANENYKASIKFDAFILNDVQNYLKTISSIYVKGKKPQNITKNTNFIDIFSIIGKKRCTLDFNIIADKILVNNLAYFENFTSAISMQRENINFSIESKYSNDASFTIKGNFAELNSNNPYGFFSMNAEGESDSYNIFRGMFKFFTKISFKEELELKHIKMNFDILFKKLSTIIQNISINIDDLITVDGNIQFTESYNKDISLMEIRDISMKDMDIKNFNFEKFDFRTGDSLFQRVINNADLYKDYVYHFENIISGDNFINNAKINSVLYSGVAQIQTDIDSNQYKFLNSILIDVRNQVPILHASIFMKDVVDFIAIRNDLENIFIGKILSLPSFEKFKGDIILSLKDSILFGSKIEKFLMFGRMDNGIMTFEDQEFSGVDDGTSPVVSGKLGGKIDLLKTVPFFDINVSFINVPTNEFQKIFRIKHEYSGLIAGGGSFAFSGFTYKEFITSLQMKTKFILQKIIIPNLNLDSISQSLISVENKKFINSDKNYIEGIIAQNDDTPYNVIFSVVGGKSRFTLDFCNIKTAYTGGACTGIITVENDQLSCDIVSKFVVPALNINNNLTDVMKLYILHQVKYTNGEYSYTTDLSHIYQYMNYRRATFGI